MSTNSGKTFGDGVSRVAALLETAGSSVSELARDLSSYAKTIVETLGAKAQEVVGPASGMIARLMDQYVEEQKACAQMRIALGIKKFVLAMVCGLASVMLAGVAYYFFAALPIPENQHNVGLNGMLGASSVVAALMLFIGAIVVCIDGFKEIETSMRIRASITSASVDTLIQQFRTMRGR